MPLLPFQGHPSLARTHLPGGHRGGQPWRAFVKGRRLLLLLALSGACPALGQISSEEAPRTRTVPLREQVKWESENAPYRLGTLKVRPLFNLRDLGYNNNVFGSETNKVGDFTATVSAGVKVLQPLGLKMALQGKAAPEYTWYEKLVGRRNLGGAYAASLLGLFNRMTLEAGGGYQSQATLINSESEQEAVQTRTSGLVRVEVDILQHLSVFAGFDAVKSRYDDKGFTEGTVVFPVDLLDRTELALRGGIRYRFSGQLGIGAQVERTRADFVHEGDNRNNESIGYLLVVRYDHPRFYLDASGGYREGKGRDGAAPSLYPGYQTGTYSFFASYFIARPVELQVFGHRRPVDSYFLDNPYYFETRNAIAVQVSLGRRVIVRGFASVGPNSYPTVVLAGTNGVVRRDDSREFGGGLLFRFHGNAAVSVGGSQARYTSNIDGLTRSVLRVSTGISLEGDFNR